MSDQGKFDQVKGRVKEAAGALSDDDGLRDEGKVDQVAGKVKDTAHNVVDKVKQAAEDLVNPPRR